MSTPSTGPAWQRAILILSSTVVTATIVCLLFWMKDVLIPLVLAVYLSFVLNPIVRMFEKRGLHRLPSVIFVVVLLLLVVFSIGSVVTRQVRGLIYELPEYRTTIIERVRAARDWKLSSGPVGKLVKDVVEELNTAGGAAKNGSEPASDISLSPVGETSPPVPVVSSEPRWVSTVTDWLTEALSYAGLLVLSLILVIFILLKREDLRNRFIWIVGRNTLTSTTKAVEDAATRVSRLLLAQLMVNASFGVIVAIGLWLLGVRYALLWGLLGAVLRYLPYVGAWLSAIFPVGVSLAMSNGWGQPISVALFIGVIELVTGNFLEPYLFGRSIGVSEIALLVGAAFWTWLWGPIGLILSPPMTVVLVVLGKHVPYLASLEVLLGDAPTLSPEVAFYQRLLARDEDEAMQLILSRTAQPNPQRVYDEFLIPALAAARRGRERNEISRADEESVWSALKEILDDLGETSRPEESDSVSSSALQSLNGERRIRLLGVPARDEADRLALEMLAQLLPGEMWEVIIPGSHRLASELADQAADADPDLICIGSVSHGSLARSRYLCKRLRSSFPGTRIFVGRWMPSGEDLPEPLPLEDAGAQGTQSSLLETRDRLLALQPVYLHGQRTAAEIEAFSRRDFEPDAGASSSSAG